eukprot:1160411-Pelagomonas_calceolata.AAC.3
MRRKVAARKRVRCLRCPHSRQPRTPPRRDAAAAAAAARGGEDAGLCAAGAIEHSYPEQGNKDVGQGALQGSAGLVAEAGQQLLSSCCNGSMLRAQQRLWLHWGRPPPCACVLPAIALSSADGPPLGAAAAAAAATAAVQGG